MSSEKEIAELEHKKTHTEIELKEINDDIGRSMDYADRARRRLYCLQKELRRLECLERDLANGIKPDEYR